jgi:hypothetical protein
MFRNFSLGAHIATVDNPVKIDRKLLLCNVMLKMCHNTNLYMYLQWMFIVHVYYLMEQVCLTCTPCLLFVGTGLLELYSMFIYKHYNLCLIYQNQTTFIQKRILEFLMVEKRTSFHCFLVLYAGFILC